jgi:hypothetical protein
VQTLSRPRLVLVHYSHDALSLASLVVSSTALAISQVSALSRSK